MQRGFLEEEKRGVYRAIAERRDVRSQFLPAPIPDAVLARLLWAAHCAPFVGLMQPWEFIVIHDATVKQRVSYLFERANRKAAGIYDREQRVLYDSLKLAGILEAPINLSRPELEIKGWEQSVPLAELIHFDTYGGRDSDRAVRLAGSAATEYTE